jgi:hypothetical protein
MKLTAIIGAGFAACYSADVFVFVSIRAVVLRSQTLDTGIFCTGA